MAILIGRPDWHPSQRLVSKHTGHFIDQSTGQYTGPTNVYARAETHDELSLPSLWTSAPRMYWDPDTQQFSPA